MNALIMKVWNRVARVFRGRPREVVLRRLPREGVGAEIGVWKGHFSARLLQATNPRELHLIDPWAFQPDCPDRMYGGSHAHGQEDMDAIFAQVRDGVGTHPAVTIHRGTSATVLGTFDAAYFDWIYIDGDHSYTAVLEDLELAFRTVRPGGMIAGDDYRWGPDEGCPVRRAVRDFLRRKGLKRRRLKVIGTQFLIQRP